MLQLLLIAGIFFVALLIALFVLIGQERKKHKRNIELIRGRADTGLEKSGRKDPDKRREDLAKKLKDSGDEGKEKKNTLSLRLLRAGLQISVLQFWLYAIISAALCAGLAWLSGLSPFVVGMIGLTALLGLPRFVLSRLAARRQKKFLEEFPDALEAVVRLLKAGMPVSEAVHMISREFEGPVGEEMALIYDKQKIGIPIQDAALDATHRIPLAEMQMFATGLAIQAQTGSSLSEVLMNLANVIRARFKLKRKIRALSSEAIASAGIIGSLPVLLTIGFYFANRDYIMILFENSFGNVLLAGAVIWMMIGVIVMRGMINFKI